MTNTAQEEIISRRRGTCARCGAPGVHVDTTAGEIVEGGDVIASIKGEPRLMVDVRDRLTCDDCDDAGHRP